MVGTIDDGITLVSLVDIKEINEDKKIGDS